MTTNRTPGTAIKSRFSIAIPDLDEDDDEDEEEMDSESSSKINSQEFLSANEGSIDYTDVSYTDRGHTSSKGVRNHDDSINYTDKIYKQSSPSKKRVSSSPGKSKETSSTLSAIHVNANGGIDPSHLGVGVFRGDVINDGITKEFDGYKFEHSRIMMQV
jgi:hypothetical protein